MASAGGARLTMVLPDEPGDAADRLRAAGVTVIQLPLLRPRASRRQQGLGALVARYPGQIMRLRRLIREEAVDVVEVHGLLNVDGAVAGRLAGRGVIWQLIDTRPPRLLRWLVMPVVLMLADVIMTTGRAVAHQYPGAGLRPSRLVPFVPPVDAGDGPGGRAGSHPGPDPTDHGRLRPCGAGGQRGQPQSAEGLRVTHRRSGRLPETHRQVISSCGSGVRFRPDTRVTPRSYDCTPFPGDSPPRRWAVSRSRPGRPSS